MNSPPLTLSLFLPLIVSSGFFYTLFVILPDGELFVHRGWSGRLAALTSIKDRSEPALYIHPVNVA